MAKPNITLPTYGRQKKTVHRRTPKSPSFKKELESRISSLGDSVKNAAKVAGAAALGYAQIKAATASTPSKDLTTFNKANSVTIGNIPKGEMKDNPPVPKGYGRKLPVMAVASGSTPSAPKAAGRKVESPIVTNWDTRLSVQASAKPAVSVTPPAKRGPDRGSYSRGGGKMVVAPKPSALDASLSSAPSRAKASGVTGKTSFSKVASSDKDMSPKTNSDLNQMSQSKPAVAPASKGVDRGSYTRGGGPMPKPKSGGFLSGLKSALTKKPTARGPSEYEQIMTDIQPSRKKKR